MTVLRFLGENLWLADGPVISVYGLPFSTRMAIVRLKDGGLWLWSPVQLDEDLRREVRSLRRSLQWLLNERHDDDRLGGHRGLDD